MQLDFLLLYNEKANPHDSFLQGYFFTNLLGLSLKTSAFNFKISGLIVDSVVGRGLKKSGSNQSFKITFHRIYLNLLFGASGVASASDFVCWTTSAGCGMFLLRWKLGRDGLDDGFGSSVVVSFYKMKSKTSMFLGKI